MSCIICGSKSFVFKANANITISDDRGIVINRTSVQEIKLLTHKAVIEGNIYCRECRTKQPPLDICEETFCPGCEKCKNYAELDTCVSFCASCLMENPGQITTDSDCKIYECPWFKVRNHYGLTLDTVRKFEGECYENFRNFNQLEFSPTIDRMG